MGLFLTEIFDGFERGDRRFAPLPCGLALPLWEMVVDQLQYQPLNLGVGGFGHDETPPKDDSDMDNYL
jgi:hypothetical protein